MSKLAEHPARPLRLNLQGGFIRRTDLSYTDLEDADLSRADASAASFVGANFRNASLKGTVLKGADLRGAINLTREQLAEAIIDEQTKLPDHLRAAAE